jgi:hypothetical protein
MSVTGFGHYLQINPRLVALSTLVQAMNLTCVSGNGMTGDSRTWFLSATN